MPSSPSLFDTEPSVYGVSALIADLTGTLEAAYGDVWVEGELSNFKRHHSGHCYFSVKDSDAQLRCVMWRPFTEYLFFQPQDGLQVRLHGHVSVYGRRGDLQLVARSMRLAGEGALQKAFEALKRKLTAEGLFDDVHKRPLPRFPETIGIVTSGSGAALHDMLTVLRRRFPQVRVLVCPVQVQGLGAAEAIAEAVEAFSAVPPGDALQVDVLIVGRGGGSAEDLWAFNEEVVARALFACTIPVISAVGHEVDHSIADYVADVRAATPSMAAELAVPNRAEVDAYVRGLHGALHSHVTQQVGQYREHVYRMTDSYRFNRPIERLQRQGERLRTLVSTLHRAARRGVADEQRTLATLERRLNALNPRRPLNRGYAWVEKSGRPVLHAGDLQAGDAIRLRFEDGEHRARIDGPP